MYRITIGAAGLARPKTVTLDLADPWAGGTAEDQPEIPPADPVSSNERDAPGANPEPPDSGAPDPRQRSTQHSSMTSPARQPPAGRSRRTRT